MTELLEMKFYKVDTNYLNELRKIDGRVPLNKEYVGSSNKVRPYIGIMLVVDGIDYLVPLTSKLINVPRTLICLYLIRIIKNSLSINK